MVVALTKGANVSLSKEVPGLRKLALGLGWDPRRTDGKPFDLDASIFLLNAMNKVRAESDFVFYNNRIGANGAVVHGGDNLTGLGDGDDETVIIDLEKVPDDIQKIVIAVTIYEGVARGQNFGLVDRAYVRVVNFDGGAEIARFDLTEDGGTLTAMIFGEVYKYGNEWKFRAMGQGYVGGFRALVESYGVAVA